MKNPDIVPTSLFGEEEVPLVDLLLGMLLLLKLLHFLF